MYSDPRVTFALFAVAFVLWLFAAVYVFFKTKRPRAGLVKDSFAALLVMLGVVAAGVVLGEIGLYIIKGW